MENKTKGIINILVGDLWLIVAVINTFNMIEHDRPLWNIGLIFINLVLVVIYTCMGIGALTEKEEIDGNREENRTNSTSSKNT